MNKKKIQVGKKIIILILMTAVFRLSFMPFIVRGESMLPTLHNMDVGIGVRTTLKDIQRFDIVIVKVDNKLLIKRVIGLPNETVVYRNNNLSIDGIVIEDKYGNGITQNISEHLKENEYFCLGDNREHSSDSRIYGAFNIKDIKAISIFNKGEK